MAELVATRRVFLIGPAAVAAAAALPASAWESRDLHELIAMITTLLDGGREFDERGLLGARWMGRNFDLGFAHGVAIKLPNGRRHAVRASSLVVEELGARPVALAAINELLTWASTNG